MAGIALKGQFDFALKMVTPVPLKEKCFRRKAIYLNIDRNAACSRLLMESSVVAFRILLKYIGAIFPRLEVFKEIAPNLILEVIDILSRFWVRV